MALTKVGSSGLTDSSVTSDKLNTSSVTSEKIATDAVTVQKTAFDSNTDSILIPKGSTGERTSTTSGSIRFNTTTNSLEYYDGSDYVILENAPTLTSVSPTQIRENDSSLTTTFIITGTNFKSGITAHLRSHTGSIINFDTVIKDSATQLTCVITNSNVIVQAEPFDVIVTSATGKTAELLDQISINNAVYFDTASGSLGTQRVGNFSATVLAIDPESGVVTYDLYSGTLPTGITLNTSTGVISGTITPEASETTYSFAIRATDAGSNTTIRDFSITLSGPSYSSFTSSGTFSVPSGITSVDVLVVAGGGGSTPGGARGGGGGAGGLIFRPGFPVTPGGTVSVTVGCGGAASSVGQDSVFGTLTAKGGGNGGAPGGAGAAGGSGGGGGGTGGTAGTATQPTQPGDSGTYGFGNAGGSRNSCTGSGAGGGGGAGGAGGQGAFVSGQPCWGGSGGTGRAYTIADGTTPVYYAGGGGGGGPNGSNTNPLATSGGGGIGAPAATPGVANKGGGAGGANPGLSGGKGIVIVKY